MSNVAQHNDNRRQLGLHVIYINLNSDKPTIFMAPPLPHADAVTRENPASALIRKNTLNNF